MLNGEYRIALLEVHRTVMPPVLISAAWSLSSGGYRGEWFVIYPKMDSKLFQGRADTGAGFDMQKTLSELDRLGMAKVFSIEYEYCEARGIVETFQVPKATDVSVEDIAQHWLRGAVTPELREVAQATNCPALKHDLLAIIQTSPVA
jgi:hypothetical protein